MKRVFLKKGFTMKINKKQLTRLSFFIFLLIPVLIFIPFYIKNEAPGNMDLLQFFMSKKAWAENILQGESPQWNKYLANGIPQSGVTDLYIVSTVLSFLPLKIFVLSFFIVHLFLGGFFFYKYLRESGCSFWPSYILAILYECSIHINGLRKGHPSVVAAICLFPVIMFLVKKFFNTRESKWLFLSAIVSGIQMTIGTQYGTYGVLAIFFYLLIRAILEKYSVKELVVKGVLWVLLFVGTYAYALLPSLSILREYASYGASDTSWGTFSSYSPHPIKLLQMVYPALFGDVNQAMGSYQSSEMDVEIYLGIFILFLVISAVRTCKKKPKVILEIFLAAFAFLYACVAHIPFFGELVYRLPVLGSFRCSGRMLYIFIFFLFSLAGQELENIWKDAERENYVRLKFIEKTAKIFLGITAGIVICSIFSTRVSGDSSQLLGTVEAARDCFGMAIIVLLVIIIVTGLCRNASFKREKMKKYIIVGSVFVLTLAEVAPYSRLTHPVSFAAIEKDATVEQLRAENDEYKVLDALASINVAHQTFISQNMSISWKLPGINAYTAYNNPLLCKYLKPLGVSNDNIPFNLSGMLSGSQNMGNLLLFQNDLLSMMGIKYIIDSDKLIESCSGMTFGDMETEIYASEEAFVMEKEGEIGVAVLPLEVQPDSCYKVKFKVKEGDAVQLSTLVADIYGGSGYDRGENEMQLSLEEGRNEYEALLYSGDFEGVSETVRIRLIAASAAEKIEIEACSIFQVTGEETYEYFTTDEMGYRIYENKNAKPVLYFADEAQHIDSNEELYQANNNINLDTIAYVEGESKNYDSGAAQAEILKYTHNILEAEVQASEEAFLCFSNNYSPHWKVYVDGEKQELQMVNGLIMGLALPEGEHTVKFVYHDNAYMIGNIITIVTLASFLAYIIVSRRKRKDKR